MSAQTVLLFGPPGAGKGTQAKLLQQRMRVPHVSTGDMFRDHLGRRTDLGLKVEKLLNDGNLVPDAITNEMVRDRLLRPDTALGVILDGYPRSVPQAIWLRGFLEPRGFGVRAVVVIDVPLAELFTRLKSRAQKEGRADDADAASIQRRLDGYKAQTEACLGFYRTHATPVHVVDGVGSIDAVASRIGNAIGA